MNFQIKRERLLASTMIAGLALVGLATPAMAQTIPPEQASELGDVVVTGSRIARQDYVANSPVSTVSGFR